MPPATAPRPAATPSALWPRLRRWFDSADAAPLNPLHADRIDWLRALPFIGLHAACLAVLWTGVSATALLVAVLSYAVRMFALTGFYHRYFSHRSFRTGRAAQFVFAVLGASCVQRGPLWWAAHHRNHHRFADTGDDPHSPRIHGFLWSHVGWFLTPRAFSTDMQRVADLARFPELRWLDRYDIAVPLLMAGGLYGLGSWLGHAAPQLHTSGAQLLEWGFVIATVALFHATVTINSLAHRYGSRRFDTRDDSRNNLWLALLTFGEGWHNNHHHYPNTVRQGFRWWEIDITWYGLSALAALGLIRDLRPIPAHVLAQARGR